jgi:hypothetical protein
LKIKILEGKNQERLLRGVVVGVSNSINICIRGLPEKINLPSLGFS